MESRKLIKHLTLIIFVIFLVNFFANKFYWYYSVWWFDMPMHFWGGFWLGLAVLYILPPKVVSFRSVLTVLLLVLLAGVGWEVFEVSVGEIIIQNSFNIFDTFSDVFFDLSGGVVAVLYFLKRIMTVSESEVQLK